MPGLLIAVLLIASLLLVHLSMRAQPLRKERPLDVDDGLPLPEVAQASTVFSLTALFGAYLAIYLVLGLPALTGLAAGTSIGLLLLRYWINRSGAKSFEGFLAEVLGGSRGNRTVLALVISGVQCAYAASEILILREIGRATIGLRGNHAAFVAILIAIIGYFYILFGGYRALFRTDVLQFVLIAGMALALTISAMHHAAWSGLAITLAPRPGYWGLPLHGPAALLWGYHFAIGVVMGAGLVAASPDAWKRVFIVTKMRRETRSRFFIFVGVGMAPFLLLIPMAAIVPPVPDGAVRLNQLFASLLEGEALFIAAALGLVGSFLSAFNSALLASVHVGLVSQRRTAQVEIEAPRFHWLMVTALIVIFLLFLTLTVSHGNPYLLANVLLGGYALIAGVQLGTSCSPAHLPENSLLWVFVIGAVIWFFYFVHGGLPPVPTTYQVNTVPGGVLLCLATMLTCRILAIVGARRP